MTTPFDDQGRVDVEAVEQQAGFLIEKGVNCLYTTGTTGEMYLCSPEERELIAETVVKKAAGRVTVYVHTGAMSQEETVRISLHAHRIGADGISIVTPSYFTLDERAMICYYRDVCNALPEDFPVYVYVIPQLAHNDITPETLEKICEVCKNVVGVKYSYPDMGRLLGYVLVKGGTLSVVSGADHLFLSALASGVDGIVSGCAGPFPEPFVEIYDKYQKGDLKEASKVQRYANELVRLMRGGADMAIFKSILTLRGIRGGHMRKPLLDLTEQGRDKLYEEVKRYL